MFAVICSYLQQLYIAFVTTCLFLHVNHLVMIYCQHLSMVGASVSHGHIIFYFKDIGKMIVGQNKNVKIYKLD